jgi:hypothetical protein
MLNPNITTQTLQSSIPENLFLAIGGRANSESGVFDPSDNFLLKRIPKANASLIIPRKDWSTGEVYIPWKPNTTTDDNYYAWNSKNGILYVCLSNTPNNTVGESGAYLTTQEPTHTSGKQSYSDGYTWLALWQVDYTNDNFITPTTIPVPTFDVKGSYNSLTLQYATPCGSGYTSFGACCLYYKETVSDPFSGVTHAAGSLDDHTIFSSCYECTEIAKALNKESLFVSGVSAAGVTQNHTSGNPLCPSSITIKTLKDKLTDNINFLAPNSSNLFQLNAITNHESNERGIMSATINFGDIRPPQRRISTPNPRVVVVDPDATSEAVVYLKTMQVGTNSHEIYGIEVVSSGSGYTIPSFYIEGYETSVFNSLIELYMYPPALFENPTALIPPNKYLVQADITEQDIRDNIINTSFTKLALTTSAKDAITGTENTYADAESTVYSMQALAKVEKVNGEPPLSPALPPELVAVELPSGFIVNQSTGKYEIYISGAQNADGRVFKSGTGWIEGYELQVNDIRGSLTVNDTVMVEGVTHTVFSVTEPELDKNVSYFSVKDIDIQLPDTTQNRAYSFIVSVNT